MNRKKQEATSYKYIEVVRKKDEREKLNGYACRDCQKVSSLDIRFGFLCAAVLHLQWLEIAFAVLFRA